MEADGFCEGDEVDWKIVEEEEGGGSEGRKVLVVIVMWLVGWDIVLVDIVRVGIFVLMIAVVHNSI